MAPLFSKKLETVSYISPLFHKTTPRHDVAIHHRLENDHESIRVYQKPANRPPRRPARRRAAAPTPEPHDIRVAVSAVSVNPVDAKVRKSALPEGGEPRVLGYDAVGVVDAVGSAVTRFQPGDRVWYAGSIARQGSNAEYQLVDERIASLAPKSLSDAQAAALPLTAITAWELLFDRLELGMRDTQGKTLLVVGAAGVLARF